jgi:predicted ATPase
MLSFDDLTEARRRLQVFCLSHEPSLMSQRSGISFKHFPEEPDSEFSDGKVHHLTTTTTCLSSLLDARPKEQLKLAKFCSEVAKDALLRPTEKWKSEGSAAIYCRCRALPFVIGHSEGMSKTIEEHVATIVAQLGTSSNRFGVGEADPEASKEQWYPPNGFHTYWTLKIIDQLKRDARKELHVLASTLQSRQDGMLLWARQQLGHQITLHSASPASSMLDTDQLAWSLAIFLNSSENLHSSLEKQDFVKQALKCLFSTQIPGVGTWQHYKPLFHYLQAGNAYCYVFETFAELLQCSLIVGPEAETIRQLLKPYCENLLDLWRYAEATKIPLQPPQTPNGFQGPFFGWCSGHRTNVTSAESWATASVFSYAQALRRLLGIWCREEALGSLNTPQSERTPERALVDMTSRGKTWGAQKASVSEQLTTLFINPVGMHSCNDRLEPDSQPIEKDHARSAILFGPPGTSKTTLVRALSDAIGWKYVEIHASHFVKQGLAQVQKTADEIFKQLSELDHSVVLFDEIDELVRERDMEKDAFGRFLTTSMLPKLAELWEDRKILYFVATNHINYFDSAIIRSHRFDALILVSPPSFDAKIEQLQSLLSKRYGLDGLTFETKEDEIQGALLSLDRQREGLVQREELEELREQSIAPEFALAKFALLRWDELEELSFRLVTLSKIQSPALQSISTKVLEDALVKIADSEWRKNKSYFDYIRDTKSERRDYEMSNVWEVINQPLPEIPELVKTNGKTWLVRAVDSKADIQIPGFNLNFANPGRVSIERDLVSSKQ